MKSIADSLIDIIEWTEEKSIKSKYIFRGQVNDWPPRAGIYRYLGNRIPENFDPKPLLIREKSLLEDFKNKGILFIKNPPKNDLEWLALAQHHSVPTRLLDWTSNVLVAAFFACKKMGEELQFDNNRQAIIWAIKKPDNVTDEILKNPFQEPSIKNLYFFDAPHIHPRISAQHSCLTIHYTPEFHHGIARIKIRKESENRIIEELNNLGINAFSISPELSGLGNNLRWLHEKEAP